MFQFRYFGYYGEDRGEHPCCSDACYCSTEDEDFDYESVGQSLVMERGTGGDGRTTRSDTTNQRTEFEETYTEEVDAFS